MIDMTFPEKARPIFKPARTKVLWGGRGSTKSHTIAMALLIDGMREPHRILCARELQSSIADSVHKLLSDKITQYGLDSFYEVQKASIIGKNGTEFFFAGLRHNINSIKSFEGCTRVWVEEAQNVSKNSWDVLIPTIRKEGSEIWISFNPELEEDETYKRFVLNPPADSIVIKMNYTDNPWFPNVLRHEMEHLKNTDREAYLNVWEGQCRQSVSGAVYGREILAARNDSPTRITKVPYDSVKPVHTFWDLGWSDYVAIWFAQSIAREYRLIDYAEYRLTKLSDIVKELQAKDYLYGKHMLPHDGAAATLAAEGQTIQQQLQKLVGRSIKVNIVPNIGFEAGKNIARNIFSQCWFDEVKCERGLYALRHYRYSDNIEKHTSTRLPLHDDSSHGADAFRYFAVGIKQADTEISIPHNAGSEKQQHWTEM